MKIEIISKGKQVETVSLMKESVGEWYLDKSGVLWYVDKFINGEATCILFNPDSTASKQVASEGGYHLHGVVKVEVENIIIVLREEEGR